MATDYTTKVTPQHRKPRFLAFLELLTTPLAQIAEVAASLSASFDVDQAVGEQLDIIGLWVGVSRRLEVPISGSFFAFNTPGLGFNQGIWYGPFTPATGLVLMDDETYRLVIKAMIKADRWDGSLWAYQEILQEAFPDHFIRATDNFNRTITIRVNGPVLTATQAAILQTGPLSKIRPAGISIAAYVLPT